MQNVIFIEGNVICSSLHCNHIILLWVSNNWAVFGWLFLQKTGRKHSLKHLQSSLPLLPICSRLQRSLSLSNWLLLSYISFHLLFQFYFPLFYDPLCPQLFILLSFSLWFLSIWSWWCLIHLFIWRRRKRRCVCVGGGGLLCTVNWFLKLGKYTHIYAQTDTHVCTEAIAETCPPTHTHTPCLPLLLKHTVHVRKH